MVREGDPVSLPSRYWLVDPLDGTDQFMTQNAEFTVNLALVQDGLPIAGVVHAPALAMTWSGAGLGSAAFSQTDQPPMAIAAHDCPAEGTILFTHRYLGNLASKEVVESRYRVAKDHKAGPASSSGFCPAARPTSMPARVSWRASMQSSPSVPLDPITCIALSISSHAGFRTSCAGASSAMSASSYFSPTNASGSSQSRTIQPVRSSANMSIPRSSRMVGSRCVGEIFRCPTACSIRIGASITPRSSRTST